MSIILILNYLDINNCNIFSDGVSQYQYTEIIKNNIVILHGAAAGNIILQQPFPFVFTNARDKNKYVVGK